MFASFQKKYYLSDKGIAGVKRGVFWTALTNLITMAGMGFLFLVMAGFVEHLASGADLPDALPIVGGLLVFFVLLFASTWQQYYYTYCIFYEECGKQRMEIAERLRKLPLSFFGLALLGIDHGVEPLKIMGLLVGGADFAHAVERLLDRLGDLDLLGAHAIEHRGHGAAC